MYHCGSAYENLATNANHDYDVMFDVVPKGSQFQVEEVQPGFSKLKYMSGASAEYRKSYVTDDGYLSRDKVMDKQVGRLKIQLFTCTMDLVPNLDRIPLLKSISGIA